MRLIRVCECAARVNTFIFSRHCFYGRQRRTHTHKHKHASHEKRNEKQKWKHWKRGHCALSIKIYVYANACRCIQLAQYTRNRLAYIFRFWWHTRAPSLDDRMLIGNIDDVLLSDRRCNETPAATQKSGSQPLCEYEYVGAHYKRWSHNGKENYIKSQTFTHSFVATTIKGPPNKKNRTSERKKCLLSLSSISRFVTSIFAKRVPNVCERNHFDLFSLTSRCWKLNTNRNGAIKRIPNSHS